MFCYISATSGLSCWNSERYGYVAELENFERCKNSEDHSETREDGRGVGSDAAAGIDSDPKDDGAGASAGRVKKAVDGNWNEVGTATKATDEDECWKARRDWDVVEFVSSDLEQGVETVVGLANEACYASKSYGEIVI